MKMKTTDYKTINRRQFVKQAGFVTGVGLTSAGDWQDSTVMKAVTQEKIPKGQPAGKQRRVIVSEDGPWWLTGDGRLTRRHLERFVEELAGVADTLAAI